MVTEERCWTCRFFEAFKKGDTNTFQFHGTCRRFPPPTVRAGFPHVYKVNWCGEYKPKEPSDAE